MHILSEKSKSRGFCLIHWLLSSAVFLTLASCSNTSRPTEPKTSESGRISVALKLSKAAAASMSRAEVVITATDMAEIRQNMTINGDTVSGEVRGIPAGNDRLFTVNGYDSSGNLIYSGGTRARVIAGQQVSVRITMRRMDSPIGKPELRISSSATAARSTSTTTTRITGEIENSGNTDATNVKIEFRARNSGGAAISDASTTIGTVNKGESELFTATFSNTSYRPTDTRYVSRADYTLTYSEGEPIEGSITVQ